ncbi:thiol reductant ABC exporter subunit CydC [Aquabacter cavernae]|uniref:thiol reductant ABC exporter subunit CydC n=1 Tax=Aquabacter cavernae TaxID=2496029 RepID=UPI000F8EA42D|nr:thiol reductant ABC exporter subunit CydC [Aquabacter cavernae]
MSLMGDLKPVVRLFLAERRGMLAGGLACAALTILAGMALLGISGWFITATALAGLSTATAVMFDVFAPAAAIRLLAIGRTGARYGERLTTHDAALTLLAGLRERLFRGWAQPGAARALEARPARLLFRLTADIDALDSLYLRLAVPLAAAVAALLATGIALGLMEPRLGLAVAGVLAVAWLGLPLLAALPARRPARRRAHGVETLRADVIDLVAGQAELAMAGRLPAQQAVLAASDAAVAMADDALNRMEVRTAFGFGAAGALALAGTLVGVAALMEHGVIGAPVAALGVLVPLAALEPFAAFRRGALELGRTLLAVRRIGPRLREAAPAARPALPSPGLAARLSGVEVRHAGRAVPAVQGIDLDVAAGSRVALVGPSGAGKSTLLALLAGEIAPSAGTAEALAATLLTQRTQLFHDTIADNLRLAAPTAGEERLWQVLEEVGLAAAIRALPSALETPMGEAGLGLSGGQGRRLAVARLLLRDTPLWLLDEPTDGLDARTARHLLDRVGVAAEGRTLVIATHIRREADLADRLVVVEDGRIVRVWARGEAGFAATLAALRAD